MRPGQLAKDEASVKYRVLLHLTGVTVGKSARADVAKFALPQLTNNDLLGKTSLLTY